MPSLADVRQRIRAGLRSSMEDRALYRVRRFAPRAALWSIIVAAVAAVVESVPAAPSFFGWVSAVAAVLAVVSLATWATARGVLWWRLGRARWGFFAPAARRERMASIYAHAIAQTHQKGIALVRVKRVYQVARRGTKCVVEHPSGIRQDAWFWHVRPRRGQVFLVRSTGGYGGHNNIHTIMYIGTDMIGSGILARVPAAAWRIGRRPVRS